MHSHPFSKIRFSITVAVMIMLASFSQAVAGTDRKAAPHLIVAKSAGTISIDAYDVETADLLAALADKTGTAIAVGKGVFGKITVKISAATIGEILKAISQNTAIVYEYQQDTGGWRVLKGFAFSASGTDSPRLPDRGRIDRAVSDRVKTPQQAAPLPATVSAPGKQDTAAPATSNAVVPESRPAYKKGELLVRFRKEATVEEIAALHARLGNVVLRTIPHTRVQRIRLKAGLDEIDAIREYQKAAIVEHIERHALRYLQATPNDLYFGKQWGMEKIAMENLWDISTDNREIIVAVIDSGVNYLHPDLRDNIWVNTAEQNGYSGVDDDHNNYVDDIYGYDFAGMASTGVGDNDPMDTEGHGTHVSGIIGAVGNNGIGISGINWKIKIMPLKVMTDNGSEILESAILEAIYYAIDNGAKIVNCSFGGTAKSDDEEQAFASLREKGILAVCAAGNEGKDMDDSANNKMYPACYDLDNIISVAATTQADALASYSNYGKTTVDIAAPGDSIYSTLPGGGGTTASVKAAYSTAPSVEYAANGMAYSPVTSDAGLFGVLYNCGMGYPDEIPPDVTGNIALIKRGSRNGTDFFFSDKVLNARAKGAVGVIIYNNLNPGDDTKDTFDTYGGTLGSPGNWVPTISITKASGEALLNYTTQTLLNVTLLNVPSGTLYGYMSGTSMAAPHVAGLAAVLFGQCPTIPYSSIRNAIINRVDKVASLTDKVASGGRINAYQSLISLFPPGDLSFDCRVDLADAILALRILAGFHDVSGVHPPTPTLLDADGDTRIGLAEVVFILQTLSALR